MSFFVTADSSDEEIHRTRDLGLAMFKEADAEIVRRQRLAVDATPAERRAAFRVVTA